MNDRKRLAIGKIVATHGIGGAVRVYSYAQSPSFFHPGQVLFTRAKTEFSPLRVASARPHKNVVLMTFEGVGHIDDALDLVGSRLYCDAAALPACGEDEYYWHELVGLSVFHVSGKYLGRLKSILPTKSNDVYVVENSDDPDAGEILIPAIASVVLEVDVHQGVMRVDLPEMV